jgi:hypothetical protein
MILSKRIWTQLLEHFLELEFRQDYQHGPAESDAPAEIYKSLGKENGVSFSLKGRRIRL